MTKLYPEAIRDERVRDYLPAKRLIAGENYTSGNILVGNHEIQVRLNVPSDQYCSIAPGGWILLDFGLEIHGGIRLLSLSSAKIRLRFGESVGEAMLSPNQDHAIHDAVLQLPQNGMLEYGNTAFRFVRIDALESSVPVKLLNVPAVAVYRELEWGGCFESSDSRLNQIWKTGAYTVLLNMQDYIYDGPKRDRLVWMGDLNPEIRTILSVFTDYSLVPKTLDFIREHTPLPGWMNGIASYSIWFVITQEEYFQHSGDLDYLARQWDYIADLMEIFSGLIAPDGAEQLPGIRLLDWPNADNKAGTHAGFQGLLYWGFASACRIAEALHQPSDQFRKCMEQLRRHIPDCGNCKSAAAMQTISGLADRTSVLLNNPTGGLSTFYGGYILEPQPTAAALEVIRRYWGGMLDEGATTFWEDFDLNWLPGSQGITEIPQADRKNIHVDFGDHCYKSIRHSLCHGWASGVTAFLSHRVLGIKFLEPGGRKIALAPDLGDLDYVRGSYPTPQGIIQVEADASGAIVYSAPPGVKVLLNHDGDFRRLF